MGVMRPRSSRSRRWPLVAVILVTPPPVDEVDRLQYGDVDDGSSQLPERINESAGAYAWACVEVEKQSGLRAIDIWSRMQSFPGWQTSFLGDGLHLTSRGNRLLFEEVVWALRDANLSLEALPADLLLCSDIDPNNAVKHFEHIDAIPQD